MELPELFKNAVIFFAIYFGKRFFQFEFVLCRDQQIHTNPTGVVWKNSICLENCPSWQVFNRSHELLTSYGYGHPGICVSCKLEEQTFRRLVIKEKMHTYTWFHLMQNWLKNFNSIESIIASTIFGIWNIGPSRILQPPDAFKRAG